MKLEKPKQCHNCPWRVDSDPYAIPGYRLEMHKNLDSTIADPGAINLGVNAMACHDSPDDQHYYCIGWLDNQIGVGNNIGLRMLMLGCENADEIEVFGEQHQRLEDTLPDEECRSGINWED